MNNRRTKIARHEVVNQPGVVFREYHTKDIDHLLGLVI